MREVDISSSPDVRAMRLFLELRDFSASHREYGKINWSSDYRDKFMIYYNHRSQRFSVDSSYLVESPGVVYFDSYEACQEAIKTFEEELLWYFNEYLWRL